MQLSFHSSLKLFNYPCRFFLILPVLRTYSCILNPIVFVVTHSEKQQGMIAVSHHYLEV